MKYEIEVWSKPGVTDAAGDSVKKGIQDLNVKGVDSVKAGQVYIISGKITRKDVEKICSGLLSNNVVQTYKIKQVK